MIFEGFVKIWLIFLFFFSVSFLEKEISTNFEEFQDCTFLRADGTVLQSDTLLLDCYNQPVCSYFVAIYFVYPVLILILSLSIFQKNQFETT